MNDLITINPEYVTSFNGWGIYIEQSASIVAAILDSEIIDTKFDLISKGSAYSSLHDIFYLGRAWNSIEDNETGSQFKKNTMILIQDLLDEILKLKKEDIVNVYESWAGCDCDPSEIDTLIVYLNELKSKINDLFQEIDIIIF